MKRLIFVFTLLFAARLSAQEATVATTVSFAPQAAVAWEAPDHDFGTVEQHRPVTYAFAFTNTGQLPLVITSVRGSCGCTAVSQVKAPVAPGETGTITATYNAARAGAFHKTVTVQANTTEGSHVLHLRGEVVTAQGG
ncbi:MAG: DUF1573 domain-containing protein [Catalinimonas sp.]